MARVLNIDLTTKSMHVDERSDLRDKYIGGTGIASQLFLERQKIGADALSPDNNIVFAIGPLNAMFPCMSKTVCVFKSPLTGGYGESHAGGRLSAAMRFAGYDAIVIGGKSEAPVYISIHGDAVRIKNAETLWGTRTIETVGKVLREREPGGAGRRSILRIGRAGENLVRYACVNVDTHRHFGRMGLGAVFGSKNLKALTIEGTRDYKMGKIGAYKAVYDEVYNALVKTHDMEKYHNLGTPANVLPLNHISSLPTRNFSSGTFESADKISGESFAEELLARKIACVACPIGCVHIAALRELFSEGHDYTTKHIAYDYELIYALGSNLGISAKADILRLIEACEKYGMDAMSTGVVLSWATEAFKKCLISEKETGGLTFGWGVADSYVKAIENIANVKSDFYAALGFGADYAAEKYGGSEYAIAIGKNENAGYHTGPAHIIAMAIGMRHSHLSSGGYSIDEKNVGKDLSPEETVDRLVAEEQFREVYNSLVGCLFARGVYTKERIVKCLAAADINKNEQELDDIGRNIYENKNKIRLNEGFKVSAVRIPKRLFETGSASGIISEDKVKRALEYYAGKMNLPY